ncbi:hypothetical protein RMR10_012070 [Agrobacterium rosae]|uniref:hypothetical protein n=1 Tax=Agrobacterium rosae TaxID=1972867 RepID=UPI002A16A2AE|nr:hypothetical protein [Agrobacterium rosae]MDX8313365.1 hypothetical protein [Agrobacterium rosae]
MPNTIPAAGEAMPTDQNELPVDRVDRLSRELAETLSEWANGSFMAMVYPEGDARGYWFRSINAYDRKGHPDPVANAVQAYRDGEKAYGSIKEADWNAHGGNGAVVAKTYGPPLDVLKNWNQAAVTKLGAMTALRFALEEADNFGCEDEITAMIRAALGYLEGTKA